MDSILANVDFLEWMRIVLFISGFVFSSSYLIPSGILAIQNWKKTGTYSKLSIGVTFCAGGVFLLIYLLVRTT